MKITETELVERNVPEGGVNFICDCGINKTYRYRFLVYCEKRDKFGGYEYTIGLYFDEDMSDELYYAITECLGKCFFDDLNSIKAKTYHLAISQTQKIECKKLVDYVAKYLHTNRSLTSIYKLYFTKGVYDMKLNIINR